MKYKFRTLPYIPFILILLLLMFGIILPSLELFVVSEALRVCIFFAEAGAAWFIAQFVTRGKVQVEISDMELKVKWLRRPFGWYHPDRQIKISDIVSWRFQEERNVDTFRVFLHNSNLKFQRDSLWSDQNDDFGKFLRAFRKLVVRENDNRRKQNVAEVIDEEVGFHKSGEAKRVYYIFLIAISILVLLTLFNWYSSDYPIAFPLAAIVGGLFYVYKYRPSREKKTADSTLSKK